MSLRLLSFGDTPVPEGNPRFPLGGFEVVAPMTALPRGAVFDEFGAARAPQRFPYDLDYRAVIKCDSPAELWQEVDRWRALVGVRDELVRLGEGRQFCYARLMRVEAERAVHHFTAMPITLTFRVLSYWRGRLRQYEETAIASSPRSFVLHNGGNLPQSDVTFRITCAGSSSPTITAVSVYRSGYSEVNWSGTLADSEYLEIEFGARAVTHNGADDYDNFEATDYDREEWLVLDPGDNTVVVSWTAGSGTVTPTVTWEYYDRWA